MDNFCDAFVEYFIRYIHEIDSMFRFSPMYIEIINYISLTTYYKILMIDLKIDI